MSTKTISTTYNNGYSFSGVNLTLDITASGWVAGVFGGGTLHAYTVDNYGTVESSGPAIYLQGGGQVTNGSDADRTAQILANEALTCVDFLGDHAATVTNFATIEATSTVGSDGVALHFGGNVTNGDSIDSTALIQGGYYGVHIYAAAGKVTNFGTIIGLSRAGVYLGTGASGTVSNFGTIKGGTASGWGVRLGDGGGVTNGSVTDTGALIEGFDGILIDNAPGTVTNFGTITSARLGSGGTVTNGSTSDTVAQIQNGVGIGGAPGTVVNWGTVGGINLSAGGKIANGGGSDSMALMGGIVVYTVTGTVSNFGRIINTSYNYANGVYLKAGGGVTNSGPHSLIEGNQIGVWISGEAGTLVNSGTVEAVGNANGFSGVDFEDGGLVTNAATGLLAGYDGIVIDGAAGTVINSGTISGLAAGSSQNGFCGVDLRDGGSVTNATSATIAGGESGITVEGAAGTVLNSGTISGAGLGKGEFGVYLHDGGSVTNRAGASIDGGILSQDGIAVVNNAGVISSTSSIKGGVLVQNGIGTVINSGTITTTGIAGVALTDGGSVTNGASASISGGSIGVAFESVTGTLTNLGTIEGTSEYGVLFLAGAGGTITTGSTSDTTALIRGAEDGIVGEVAAVAVTNFAIIEGISAGGVSLASGGTVTNGSAADTVALVQGEFGVVIAGAAGTVTNFGTVLGLGTAELVQDQGIYLGSGGRIANGSATDSRALIEGGNDGIVAETAATVTNFGTIDGSLYQGVYLKTGGAVVNFGTIEALGSGPDGARIAGVYLAAGGAVTNGGTGAATALIGGHREGVFVRGGSATVTNFGTIEGGTYSVAFSTSSDVLIAEAGSALIGALAGGGGTLALEAGVGVIGSAASGFGDIIEQAGGSWTLSGVLTAGVGSSMALSGALTLSGGATLSGAIIGTGTLAVTAGSTTLAAGAVLSVAAVSIAGTGTTVTLGASLGYAGELTTTGGTLALGTNTLTLSGTSSLGHLTISGTGGTLSVIGGIDQVNAGTRVTVSNWTQSGGTVTINEALAYAGLLTQSAGTIGVAASGTLTLTGADGFAGKITGAGSLRMSGGTDSLDAGAAVSTTAWTIAGSATTVTLAESLGYAGAFSSGSDTIGIDSGFKLILSGTAAFGGTTIDGAGTLYLAGATASGGLYLAGSVELENAGTATQAGGNLILGTAAGDATLFYNTVAATWDITDNTGIGSASTAAAIANKGLLEKTGGTGLSKVTPAITNSGTIAVTSGTLELLGTVAGTGSETIGTGAALQVNGSVAATQTVTFAAATGALILDDPSGSHLGFAGIIAGFGGSDEIDLASFAYSSATTLAWNQVTASQGRLTITDGAKSAVLTLDGTYTNGSFAQSNAGGFTLITDPPPATTNAGRHAATADAGRRSGPAGQQPSLTERIAGFGSATALSASLPDRTAIQAGFLSNAGPTNGDTLNAIFAVPYNAGGIGAEPRSSAAWADVGNFSVHYL